MAVSPKLVVGAWVGGEYRSIHFRTGALGQGSKTALPICGEFAAMTMVDSIARLVPEVLGKEESHKDDSFSTGLLEYPQYTRPKDFRGMLVGKLSQKLLF